MIVAYIKMRLGLVKFIMLATVMSLLVYSSTTPIKEWIFGITFLFISFLVFRILDDAGSVHLDRKNHRERTYLKRGVFFKFIMFSAVILTVYLICLGLYSLNILIVVGILIGVSLLCYLVFGRNKFILPIIPLLKYPALIWCLYDLTNNLDTIMLATSSLFLIASHDLIENINKNRTTLTLCLLSLFACGLLIYRPWVDLLNTMYILPILVIVFFIGKWKFSQYIPLLYFPITYFIIQFIS